MLCAVLEKLLRCQRRILNNQILVLERIEDMSQVLDQVKDFAAKIDEATNAIAARIQTLIDKINAGTATPEEIAAVLQPEVDRLTVTAEMLFDKGGVLMEAKFYPSVIRSAARLTYTAVKKILVDNDPRMTAMYASLTNDLRVMERLALRR